jgi:hypothetical protein
LLADCARATQGIEQQEGRQCDREESQRASQRKENNTRDKIEHAQPIRRTRLAFHLYWIQRLVFPHRLLESGRGSAVKFDCIGNLTKALSVSPQQDASLAECGISE